MAVRSYSRTWLHDLIKDSRSIGILLLLCTLLSLSLANSPLQQAWKHFWEMPTPAPSFLHLPHDILAWVNDALMATFFLLAGMEIKRELVNGALSSLQKALMPALAALGGMLCPALLYLSVNAGTHLQSGWAIPMATDIAFSLGILSLLGRRVPPAVKVLLMALAIIDDLGAIATIAIFYTDALHWAYLGGAAACMAILVVLNMSGVKRTGWYLAAGTALWYCMFNSGIHATIAGVLLAFCMPLTVTHTLEHRIHVPVNFIVMPLFALANTAIQLPWPMGPALVHPLSVAIMLGLFAGKPLGILLFSWLGVKTRLVALPESLGWKQLLGMGFMAGIGFTMSIFIATLAFSDALLQDIAKIGIIAASLLAGVTGFLYFAALKKK
ncbi:Na+/H+ antiporter NhaA [Chitinophaga parva]|uniref:Na(+)/H(+) antiporter NhaA n=1 Tax=Chitinophaga parva TaxID=2169414 RepID=A0A2T7BBK1_9BACT|nr:Na+/H+ antiporter NhaA [Chitinophaga parva]PUZ21766.1 Na+/H+ antiporter NhaA [Chitinophaga parva]